MVSYSTIFLQQSTPMSEYNLNKKYSRRTIQIFICYIFRTLHIGEGFSDYGTPGYFNDTMPTANDESKPAKALRQAVKWINARKRR